MMTKPRLFFALFTLSMCLLPLQAFADGGYPSLQTPAPADATGTDDVAIIVGVEEYPWLPEIDGVLDTVRDWEVFFDQSLGVRTIYRVVENQATREGIQRFIDQAREDLSPDATLWFVFVGHGAPDPQEGDAMLVGVDAQPQLDSLQARSLRRSELITALEAGPQARTVMILDACFTGEAPDGEALVPGAQPVLPTRTAPSVRSETIILSAAGAGETAGPLPDATRPAFSYFLLGALRGWAADDNDQVSVEEAINYTRSKLRMVPDRRQNPEAVGDTSIVLVRGVTEADPLPNWRGLSPRQTRQLELRQRENLKRQLDLEEQTRQSAVTQDHIDQYQAQRLFESEARFFQGTWSNALDWKTFYTLVGDEELASQYKPPRPFGIVSTMVGTGLLFGGAGYWYSWYNYDHARGGSVFSQAWQTSSVLFLSGAYLGFYLGSFFFGEKHPLEPTERTTAANQYNESIARDLGIPQNLTLSPLLGEQRGLAISFQF